MLRHASAGLLVLLCIVTPRAHADKGSHVGRHASTPEDLKAIQQVIADFQSAIVKKDGRRLSTLMLHSRIVFTSSGGQQSIDRIRQTTDVNFDGVSVGGFPAFSSFVSGSKVPIQENFYDVKVTQDGNLAWVLFDYEFVQDGKVTNHGVECWQMIKVDGKWKIFSVVWSTHDLPG